MILSIVRIRPEMQTKFAKMFECCSIFQNCFSVRRHIKSSSQTSRSNYSIFKKGSGQPREPAGQSQWKGDGNLNAAIIPQEPG